MLNLGFYIRWNGKAVVRESERFCPKEKLCIEGRNAGGLLIGSVLNMRPDLFKVAFAGVPFVDALTTMLDPTIPLEVYGELLWLISTALMFVREYNNPSIIKPLMIAKLNKTMIS
ncbi:hypothetical protein NC651_007931 [Populus alba x Populus x berolinensis]|nr:hypothetical protein NC651_007931 [Populus alba x Populus x berolinensis]